MCVLVLRARALALVWVGQAAGIGVDKMENWAAAVAGFENAEQKTAARNEAGMEGSVQRVVVTDTALNVAHDDDTTRAGLRARDHKVVALVRLQTASACPKQQRFEQTEKIVHPHRALTIMQDSDCKNQVIWNLLVKFEEQRNFARPFVSRVCFVKW